MIIRIILTLIIGLTVYFSNAQHWNKNWPVLKTYSGEYTKEVAMPLGGIGTGTVSVSGRGNLMDWEIMNRGAIGFTPAFKFVPPSVASSPFFAIYFKEQGKPGAIKVLEGPVSIDDYYGDWGADAFNAGFPRFEKTTFAAAYPLAQINFEHQDVPIEVRLEAFNPLEVGNADNSGIPVAILRYVITNKTGKPIETSVVGMVPNYIGVDGWSGKPERNYNEFRESGKVKGLFMYSNDVDSTDVNWGTIALTTPSNENVTYRTSWARLRWNWTFREFWDDFIADGELVDHPEIRNNVGNDGKVSEQKNSRIKTPPATLAVKQTIRPGETKEVTFFLTWHFPNRRGWDTGSQDEELEIVGNYYTTQYRDAWEVAQITSDRLDTLEQKTVLFVKSLVESDMPEVLKEAGLFNLNNLRSQTVFRTADGFPFGFEGTGSIEGTKIGVAKSSGWGWGSCTHVWNYESTVPFLFGDLAMKFREVEFMYATDKKGGQSFRIPLPLSKATEFSRRAADGQMGTLIKVYRDWQLSGNDTQLKEMWPNIKKSMSFAWTGIWDTNKDGVMEGSQHNTMDINYEGPNPQMAAWYLGALRASEEMSRYLNDTEFEEECKTLYEKGRPWIDDHLFNGEYYEQIIPEGKSKAAQLGKGCLVDQLVGQYLAHTANLGYVLDQKNVQKTLESIMKYNLITDFDEHFNSHRSFALDDEGGLIMASYPHGDLLDAPFPYYTEVMPGFEYSTAAHMIYEGQVEAGISVFEAIRDRYDGYKRNPFNEGEYGHRYARSMAAWAGILAYTGFQYSAVEKMMNFNSRIGTFFWSNGYQYGTIKIEDKEGGKLVTLTSKRGDFSLDSFILNGFGLIRFKKGIMIQEGIEVTFLVKANDRNAGKPVNVSFDAHE